jgi:hypothetical protein
MKMIYLNRFLPLAVIGAALAVSLPVISKADDPKETAIAGTIQLPNEGNQEAAQASLAKLTVQQAIDAASAVRAVRCSGWNSPADY